MTIFINRAVELLCNVLTWNVPATFLEQNVAVLQLSALADLQVNIKLIIPATYIYNEKCQLKNKEYNRTTTNRTNP